MKRRAFVTTGLVGILGLAGCVDQSSDDGEPTADSADANRRNDDDSGTEDQTEGAGPLEILDYEFTLASGPMPEDEQSDSTDDSLGAAPRIIDETQDDTSAEVTISGVVTGNNGCMEGQLLSAPAVDGEAITAGVGTALSEEVAKRREEGEQIACTHVIVTDRYELTIEYSGSLSNFEITQSGMEIDGKAYQLLPSWSE